METNKKGCNNCINRCMDMDMDPYCAAVNKPHGLILARGIPTECGEGRKLWELDTRGQADPRTCYVCGRKAESPMLPLCMGHDAARLVMRMTAIDIMHDSALPREKQKLPSAINGTPEERVSPFLKGFETSWDLLCLSAEGSFLTLLECVDKSTGKKIAVVAAVAKSEDNDDVIFNPIARMLTIEDIENIEVSPHDEGEEDAGDASGTKPRN